ncbi:hypothetical protein [Solwaraspora sp. WMMD792]|uniref:hypothetical protein n=1 Tax=Solwaraspora sp. WMMD792 TaxID=3016099 RepID=UPI002418124F|nr:hypothetical protein [Solwaraspora sp. WMMD792]MDG4771818.1 hypothetical protein [Solwaraspora sp. WMMD792]
MAARSALWLQLRTSVARWGFAPLLVLGLAILFGRSRFWIGIWPETGAAAQISAFFVSVFAAGLAAWIAAAVELRGLHEQEAAAAIRPVTIELTRFAAALSWLVAPYLLVAAVAFATTAATIFPPGVSTFFQYVLLGLTTIIFGTAWGWLVGKLLAPLVAAICAALSWFIATSLLEASTQLTRVSGPPWFELHLDSIAVRLAAVALFAVAVCALPARTVRPALFGRRVAVAVLALAGIVAAHLTTTVVSYRAPVAEPLCIQRTIEYCLWPEHEKYVPMIEELDREVAALPVELELPDRVVDYALSGSTQWIDEYTARELPGRFDPEFDISEGSRWGLARGVASAILGTVFADCEPQAEPDPERRWNQLFAWLEWRLAGGGAPDYRTNAPADLQAAWAVGRDVADASSGQDQAAWASTLIAEVKEHHRCAG